MTTSIILAHISLPRRHAQVRETWALQLLRSGALEARFRIDATVRAGAVSAPLARLRRPHGANIVDGCWTIGAPPYLLREFRIRSHVAARPFLPACSVHIGAADDESLEQVVLLAGCT